MIFPHSTRMRKIPVSCYDFIINVGQIEQLNENFWERETDIDIIPSFLCDINMRTELEQL